MKKKNFRLILISALFFFSIRLSVQAEPVREKVMNKGLTLEEDKDALKNTDPVNKQQRIKELKDEIRRLEKELADYGSPIAVFAPETFDVFVQPSVTAVMIRNGDAAKFEENTMLSRHGSAGVEKMTISSQLNKQDSFEFEGKALGGNDDYDANLVFSRDGLGSLTAKFKGFRKYYDSTGGFYSRFGTVNNPIEQNKNTKGGLHLDIGNFKLEGILAKENCPEYSLSYERDFRSGSKSLLEWGPVTLAGTTRNVYPASLETNEATDRVKAGVKYVTKKSEVSAEGMWESTRAKNEDNYNTSFTLPTTFGSQNMRMEEFDSDRYSMTLRGSRDFGEKLFTSCGVLFNRYVGGSMENLTGVTNRYNPASIEQNAVTVLPTVSFKPFKTMAVDLGSKAEFIDKNGDALYNVGAAGERSNISSNSYQKKFTQNLGLKYSGIERMAWYANASYENNYDREWDQQTSSSVAENRFNFKTDAAGNTKDFNLGFKWYPGSRINFTVEDNYKEKLVNNKNEWKTGNLDPTGTLGYRGYIDYMSLVSNSPQVKINYKPLRWFACNLGYSHEQNEYGIRTLAGNAVEFSQEQVSVYSAQTVFTPTDFLYCSIFYERRNDVTSTPADGSGGIAAGGNQIPDYKANSDIVGFDVSYALSKRTSLTGGYSAYMNHNFNDFSSTGMPYGLNNFSENASFGIKHSLSKNSAVEFKYKYMRFREPSSNYVNDYQAHLLSASMDMAF